MASRLPIVAAVALALPALSAAGARADDEGVVVQDLAYGEVLFEFFQEDYFSALTRLLAVAHDVEAGLLLAADGEERRVVLGLEQRLAGERPRGPQDVGRGEPGRLGQAARERRLEHVVSPLACRVVVGGRS